LASSVNRHRLSVSTTLYVTGDIIKCECEESQVEHVYCQMMSDNCWTDLGSDITTVADSLTA